MTGDRRLAGSGARPASGGPRRPNTGTQPGKSGPAGDHYSTVADIQKIPDALLGHPLLDSARTAALLGAGYAAGHDLRANGVCPGSNA